MKTVKINEKEYTYPENWEEVSFETFCQLEYLSKTLEFINDSMLIHVLTGAPHTEIRDWKDLDSFMSLVESLKGFNKLPNWENMPDVFLWRGKEIDVPDKIGQFTVQQMEDARLILIRNMKDEKLPLDIWASILSIWLQGLEGYDTSKAEELAEEVKKLPAKQVIPVGNFFLNKLMRYTNGIIPDSPQTLVQRLLQFLKR